MGRCRARNRLQRQKRSQTNSGYEPSVKPGPRTSSESTRVCADGLQTVVADVDSNVNRDECTTAAAASAADSNVKSVDEEVEPAVMNNDSFTEVSASDECMTDITKVYSVNESVDNAASVADDVDSSVSEVIDSCKELVREVTAAMPDIEMRDVSSVPDTETKDASSLPDMDTRDALSLPDTETRDASSLASTSLSSAAVDVMVS